MANDFSYTELRLMQALFKKKSCTEIAAILERDASEVAVMIEQYGEKKKMLSRDQVMTERARKKTQKSLAKVKARQSKAVVIRHAPPLKQPHRKYVTKKVDYTQLRTIRIDAKTIIYIKPGEDAETVKRDFLERIKASRDYSHDVQTARARAEAIKRSNLLK